MTTTVVNIRDYGNEVEVYIGRPSEWGNPFKIGRDGTREEVIDKYKAYIYADEQAWLRMKAKTVLKGHILGCWCSPLPCHGNILAEIADK